MSLLGYSKTGDEFIDHTDSQRRPCLKWDSSLQLLETIASDVHNVDFVVAIRCSRLPSLSNHEMVACHGVGSASSWRAVTAAKGWHSEGERAAMTQGPLPDLLGSMVKRYREQDLQLSQADLAWLAAVSRGTISNVETGKVTPDERTWHRIRTALALADTSAEEIRGGVGVRPVISADAVQGIVAAILAIRSRNRTFGEMAARRWRELVGRLTHGDTPPWPVMNSELAWLARDVIPMAPPESIPTIHSALRDWGWVSGDYLPLERGAPQSAVDSHAQAQAPFDALTSLVNDIAAQLRDIDGKVQGFGRLPADVQELLTRGLVVGYEIDHPAGVPGAAIIDFVVVDEAESLSSRKEAHDAMQRWSTIFMTARHIFDTLAPDRDPRDILDAVKYALRTQATSEADKVREKARLGHPEAMYDLGKRLRKSGRPDEAEHWLRRAAEAGHPGAWFNLARLLQESERPDEAKRWLERAADAGNSDALFHLAELKQQRGRTEEADRLLRRAAEAGHSGAIGREEIKLYERQQSRRRHPPAG